MLLTCIECGHQVSSVAPCCPNPRCGTEWFQGVRCIICEGTGRNDETICHTETRPPKNEKSYGHFRYGYHPYCVQTIYPAPSWTYNCSECGRHVGTVSIDLQDPKTVPALLSPCPGCGAPTHISYDRCRYCGLPTYAHLPHQTIEVSSSIIEDFSKYKRNVHQACYARHHRKIVGPAAAKTPRGCLFCLVGLATVYLGIRFLL
jgi:hypothetical protein